MPRVKPLTEQERKNRNLREQLVGGMKNENLTYKSVAESLGISVQTFYRRIENPETLTMKEIWGLQKLLPDLTV
jgi:DNA invertase Pin-like site-specific DNA recombinase